jgi:hypothetical protein
MNSQTHGQQHAGKTTLFVLIKNVWLQCVQARNVTKSWISSPISILSLLSNLLTLDTKEDFFYKEGLLECLPPSSPTLINYNELHWMGHLIWIGVRSPCYHRLKVSLIATCWKTWFGSSTLQSFNYIFKIWKNWEGYASLLPLNVHLMCWLAGAWWTRVMLLHDMGVKTGPSKKRITHFVTLGGEINQCRSEKNIVTQKTFNH